MCRMAFFSQRDKNLMEPSRVGPYQIERKIGAGGMGTVYFARHAETGQEVAVKTLSASLARPCPRSKAATSRWIAADSSRSGRAFSRGALKT